MWKELVILWFSCDFLKKILAIQLTFGDCPLLFHEPCDVSYIQFKLFFKNNNKTYSYILNPFQPTVPEEFNLMLPVKVLIHGYGGLSIDSATGNVSQAYQDVGYNLILVDWEQLSSLPCYATSFLNTWHVGQCLTTLLISLIPFGILPSLTHVIGFSLGAHVAGFTGANLKSFGQPLYRITGLDPALPFFATLKNEWKLDSGDANFVDVIHTSAGIFGKLEASGHVDFYVNGGTLQPFCYNARFPPLCSHITAGLYFAESIKNPTAFLGISCENVASYYLGHCQFEKTELMGEYARYKARGTYYVKTSDKMPFGSVLYYNYLFNI